MVPTIRTAGQDPPWHYMLSSTAYIVSGAYQSKKYARAAIFRAGVPWRPLFAAMFRQKSPKPQTG
jgi:hypothetical protein